MLRIASVLVALLCTSVPADAAPRKQPASSKVSKARAKAQPKARAKAQSRSKAKARVRGESGANVPRSQYRTEPLERPSGELWLRAENLGEEVRVSLYKPDGSFDDAALARLDELFRCVASGEIRAVRAELYEHLSRIQDHFGGKQLQLVSGFRFRERTSSRHQHASAADFRIKGVSIHQIRDFAATLDMGNMGIGIYPNSQFVHVDFRAPGAPSYRWTDYSGPSKRKKAPARKPGRTQPARKPVS
jgi:uncharacterized protein YcbK (DUF882 family)